MERWNETNDAAATAAAAAPVNPTETRNFWQGHRFLNFLLACMVFAFVISWLFHFNVPSWKSCGKKKKKRKEQKHFSGVDDWEAASKLMVFSTCTGTILSARISTLGVRVFLLSALMFILVAELHQTF
jgi:hypothetical protein